MVSRFARGGVAALAAAALAALLIAPLAGAHEKVVATKPAGQAKVGLGSVTVTFSGPIRSGTLKVFNAAGEKVSKGSGARDPRDVTRLRAALKPGLGSGNYTARARWVGADGHDQQYSFQFRLVR
jgi:methionine-rich copper-binding protein CopC